jgi:hypothetical protein
MICRSFLLLVFLLSTSLCWSQAELSSSPPDYKYIESATTDKKKSSYYPLLLNRYMKNDTSLSLQEMQFLYYGKFFQPGMSSMAKHSDLNDTIKLIYQKDTLQEADYRKLLALYLKKRQENPFDLGNMYRLLETGYSLKDPNAPSYDYFLTAIIRIIVATGDGKSEKSGFHIGSVDDEYSFLSIMGFGFGGSQSLIHNCDYLTVAENKYDVKGMYFNIEQILNEERKLFGLDDLARKAVKEIEKTEKQEKKNIAK